MRGGAGAGAGDMGVTETFRSAPLFLAGDAADCFPPMVGLPRTVVSRTPLALMMTLTQAGHDSAPSYLASYFCGYWLGAVVRW